ncbi:MAG: DUF1684 domain-containing protein [Stenotrophomonas sp.]
MANRTAGIGLLLMATMLGGCGGDQQTAAPAAPMADAGFALQNDGWREQRLAELQAPEGWTSLVGLHWLEWKAHYIGSGSTSGIRLAVGPPKLGMVSHEGDNVWFTPEAGVPMSIDEVPLKGRVRFHSDRDPEPTVIHFDEGKGALSLIRRGDRFALRVKHADAPSRAQFSGLQYWPLDQSWQVTARFVPHAAEKTLPIVDIIGLSSEQPNAGALEFEREGRTWRLEAIGEPGRPLFVIFADRTSGHGSYPAGRYIDVAQPDENNQVVLDFNRAYNPPCAFTPFATCPLPPPENRLDLRIEAGEKAYLKPPAQG